MLGEREMCFMRFFQTFLAVIVIFHIENLTL